MMANKMSGWQYEHGKDYENCAMEWLRVRGFAPLHRSNIDQKLHDLEIIVNERVWRIEVKGSQLQNLSHRTKGYQFLIHRNGKSDHAPSDLTMLLCMSNLRDRIAGVFVIPTNRITINLIAISSLDPRKYAGKWKKYFNNLDALTLLRIERILT